MQVNILLFCQLLVRLCIIYYSYSEVTCNGLQQLSLKNHFLARMSLWFLSIEKKVMKCPLIKKIPDSVYSQLENMMGLAQVYKGSKNY